MSPRFSEKLSEQYSRHRLPIYISLALATLVVVVFFYPHPTVSHYKYEQGRPWNYAQLIAPFDVPIRPDSATVAARVDSIDRAFVPVYSRIDVSADSMARAIRQRIDNADVQIELDDLSYDSEGMYVSLARMLNAAYDRGVLTDSLPESAATQNRGEIRYYRAERGSDGKQQAILVKQSTAGMLTNARLLSRIDSLAQRYNCLRRAKSAGLEAVVRPNLYCDVTESERLLENERALQSLDMGMIQRGQTIINKGTIITAQDYTNLRTYEKMLQEQRDKTLRNDLLITLGQALYVAMLLLAFMYYVYIFARKTVYGSMRSVVFLLLLITLFFIFVVACDKWMTGPGIYMVPLPLVAVLVLMFFDARLALMTSFTCVMLCAGLASFPLEYIALQFVGICAAIYSVGRLERRSQLFRASLYVAVSYWVTYMALELMHNGSFDDFSWYAMAALGINALLISLAYVLMLPVERVFGFVSDLTLIELTDVNSPVLRSLSEECPGTFQHSVSVGTLATDAARAVGADVLLVRAGAMYHDIGKMSNPIFFTENQHGVNPHDGLTPERSAKIITGHVPEGLRRADKAGLPAVIKDFIREHHGRGMAKYFYITACQQAGDRPVDPEPYTYIGPNPQSVETSILMMADSVEAASRSLTEHTPAAISALVDKIIDGQIADGLHSESNLTYRDVPAIKAAFVKRLRTMYHSRIAYPEAPKRPKPTDNNSAAKTL